MVDELLTSTLQTVCQNDIIVQNLKGLIQTTLVNKLIDYNKE